jgi:hypothetical protein
VNGDFMKKTGFYNLEAAWAAIDLRKMLFSAPLGLS